METEKIIRELERTIEKHKGAVLSTFETSVELMARDCLNKILELQAEVDRLKAEREWISVNDENLPENGRVGLLRFSNAFYPAVGYYSKTFDCYLTISGGQYPKSIVTHFHALPQPPEGT